VGVDEIDPPVAALRKIDFSPIALTLTLVSFQYVYDAVLCKEPGLPLRSERSERSRGRPSRPRDRLP